LYLNFKPPPEPYHSALSNPSITALSAHMAKDLPPKEDSQETKSMDYELEEESEDEELEAWEDWEAEKDDVEEEGSDSDSDSDFLCFFYDSSTVRTIF